ncbi:RNA polymerase sigma factor [Paenibacillus sp. NEAU-GSW1]|uniref:RNA polymerase sigma factor n=1 Tax=Paenibacillus sp. NEAU-GSW1 TaxID=2682486 RepID=UPI00156738C6|nr:sigma-70 family RNA polymerase sigma factor [Paenibacillus sp. NEAU-GSW1]
MAIIDDDGDVDVGMDIEETIRVVKAGNKEAYAKVVRRLQQPLYVYCCHLLMQREEAEDAVQEVFIKAFEKLERYTYDKSFSAWLYRIAYCHCMNLLNKRRRAQMIQLILRQNNAAVQTAGGIDDGFLSIERDEQRSEYEQALRRLSADDRSLLVLRFVQEKSYEDISVILSHNPAALRKKVERVKSKLKKIWLEMEAERNGFEHQPALGRTFVKR